MTTGFNVLTLEESSLNRSDYLLPKPFTAQQLLKEVEEQARLVEARPPVAVGGAGLEAEAGDLEADRRAADLTGQQVLAGTCCPLASRAFQTVPVLGVHRRLLVSVLRHACDFPPGGRETQGSVPGRRTSTRE